MKKLNLILAASFLLLFVTPVKAQTINFTDTTIYWPGWNNNTNDDTLDVLGIPNFTGGSANVNNRALDRLTINRTSQNPSYFNIISPGDLFIDIGANGNWDYVVDLTTWTTSGPDNPDAQSGSYKLYSVNIGLNSPSGYITSGVDYTGAWDGRTVRDNHPVAAELLGQVTEVGDVDFSGWGDGNTTQYTFDFDGLNLGDSGKFIIGWMPNCANDVLYETVNYAVPEPSTMLLFGLGLAGLLRKKRKNA